MIVSNKIVLFSEINMLLDVPLLGSTIRIHRRTENGDVKPLYAIIFCKR